MTAAGVCEVRHVRDLLFISMYVACVGVQDMRRV